MIPTFDQMCQGIRMLTPAEKLAIAAMLGESKPKRLAGGYRVMVWLRDEEVERVDRRVMRIKRTIPCEDWVDS